MSTRASTGLARVISEQSDDFAAKLLQKYGPCFNPTKRLPEPLPCEALERGLRLLVDDDTYQAGIDLAKFKVDAVEGLVRFMKESSQTLDEAEVVAKRLLGLSPTADADRIFTFLKNIKEEGALSTEVMKGINEEPRPFLSDTERYLDLPLVFQSGRLRRGARGLGRAHPASGQSNSPG